MDKMDIEVDATDFVRVQDTGRQLIIGLPKRFVRKYKIIKGDIFTFQIFRCKGKYSIIFDEEVSKVLNDKRSNENGN